MLNFNDILTSKIISLIIAVSFLMIDISYAGAYEQGSLRVPMGERGTYNRVKRVEETHSPTASASVATLSAPSSAAAEDGSFEGRGVGPDMIDGWIAQGNMVSLADELTQAGMALTDEILDRLTKAKREKLRVSLITHLNAINLYEAQAAKQCLRQVREYVAFSKVRQVQDIRMLIDGVPSEQLLLQLADAINSARTELRKKGITGGQDLANFSCKIMATALGYTVKESIPDVQNVKRLFCPDLFERHPGIKYPVGWARAWGTEFVDQTVTYFEFQGFYVAADLTASDYSHGHADVEIFVRKDRDALERALCLRHGGGYWLFDDLPPKAQYEQLIRENNRDSQAYKERMVRERLADALEIYFREHDILIPKDISKQLLMVFSTYMLQSLRKQFRQSKDILDEIRQNFTIIISDYLGRAKSETICAHLPALIELAKEQMRSAGQYVYIDAPILPVALAPDFATPPKKSSIVLLEGNAQESYPLLTYSRDDAVRINSGLDSISEKGGAFLGIESFANLDIALNRDVDAIVLTAKSQKALDLNLKILHLIDRIDNFEMVLAAVRNLLVSEEAFMSPSEFEKYIGEGMHTSARIPLSWARNEKHFQKLKRLIREGRVAIAHADVLEPRTMEPIGLYLTSLNIKLTWVNLSDTEDPNKNGEVEDEDRISLMRIPAALKKAGAHSDTFIIGCVHDDLRGKLVRAYDGRLQFLPTTVEPVKDTGPYSFSYTLRRLSEMEGGVFLFLGGLAGAEMPAPPVAAQNQPAQPLYAIHGSGTRNSL